MTKKVLCLLMLLLLASCATPVVSEYKTNFENNFSMTHTNLPVVNIGKFTATKPSQRSFLCRTYDIDLNGNNTVESYIRSAFLTEFVFANRYSPKAPLTITGNVDDAYVTSFPEGKWVIKLTLRSSNGGKVTVDSVSDFDTAFRADDACRIAASQFSNAVSSMINDLIGSGKLALLLKGYNGS